MDTWQVKKIFTAARKTAGKQDIQPQKKQIGKWKHTNQQISLNVCIFHPIQKFLKGIDVGIYNQIHKAADIKTIL